MRIDTIYLDMDGVLSDFMSRFREVEGEWKRTPEGMQSDGWARFCESGQFATLDVWPGAPELLEFMGGLQGINIEILTSTGGSIFHDKVAADKQQWCLDHGIFYKVNAVPGRWHKKDFARPTALLIDDTEDVIEAWTSCGGVGILHLDADQTMHKLRLILDIVR